MSDISLKKTVCYLCICLCLILFLRIPSVIKPYHNVDESIGAVAANTILNGGVLYRDAIDQRGPVTYFMYAFAFLLFGRDNMTALHCVLIFLILITALLLYLTGKLSGNRKTACWGVLFFSVFSYTYFHADMLAFHTEWAVVFFECAAAFFLLKYLLNDNRLIFLLLSGFFYGMAFFSKQFALLDFITAVLFYCFFAHFNKKKPAEMIKPLAALLSGFLLVSAVFIYYFYINAALKDFWFYFWEYNNRYYTAVFPFIKRIGIAFNYFLNPVSFLRVNFLLFITFITGGLLMASELFILLKNGYEISKDLLVRLFLFSWGLSAYLAASYTGRSFGHYFIIMLPPFCLLGGKTVQYLFDSLNRDLKNLRWTKYAVKTGLFTVIILGLASPFSYELANAEKYFFIAGPPPDGRPAFLIDRQVNELSQYIRNNSSPGENIFVWGFYPEIYCLSNRMPASRYIYCNFLTGLLPWANAGSQKDTSSAIVPGSWEIFMNELKKQMPVFIVDTSPGNHRAFGNYPINKFKYMADFLGKNYKLEKKILTHNQLPSFLLYKRKTAYLTP